MAKKTRVKFFSLPLLLAKRRLSIFGA